MESFFKSNRAHQSLPSPQVEWTPGVQACLSMSWGLNESGTKLSEELESHLRLAKESSEVTRVDSAPIREEMSLNHSLQMALLSLHHTHWKQKNEKFLQLVSEVLVLRWEDKKIHFAACGRPHVFKVSAREVFPIYLAPRFETQSRGGELLPDVFLGAKEVPSVQKGCFELRQNEKLVFYCGSQPELFFRPEWIELFWKAKSSKDVSGPSANSLAQQPWVSYFSKEHHSPFWIFCP